LKPKYSPTQKEVWKTTTAEHLIEVVDSYVRWYNEKRIKISLGALSPVEYRQSLRLAA
jgi:putative transposase